MKEQARVVVIGGGILGCSLLYSLTKQGWTDVVLVEKNELTSGTTWHAPALVGLYSSSATFIRLQDRSSRIFQGLEAETGHDVGFHKTGGLRLATHRDQMTDFIRNQAKANFLGVDMRAIGPQEVKKLFPLANVDNVVGALYTPEDGYVDASMSTNSFAQGARAAGAEIYRHTKVEGLKQKRSGEWQVITDKGTIRTEVVVNATGMWASEVGAMVGAVLPIVPMEHQYLVTDDIPELDDLAVELPVMRDPTGQFPVRQEGRGLLFGTYEDEAPFWSVDGIPPDFNQDLLPGDLDRVSDGIKAAIARVPILASVGIKQAVCGPTSRTPDQAGAMGPVCGLDGFWVFAGFSAGFGRGPAAAEQLAQWIIEGEASLNLWALDIRRYAAHATTRFTCAVVGESHTFAMEVGYPNRVKQGGRPLKTSPIHGKLAECGARFVARSGWECPDVFVADDAPAVEPHTFGRPAWSDFVAAECRAVHEGVGVLDLTSMAKYEVSGSGARAGLDRLIANSLPRRAGGIKAAPILTHRGDLLCHLMLTRLAADRFYLTAPATVEIHHLDCLQRGLPRSSRVRVENVTGRYGALLVTGPRARDVMAKLAHRKLTDRNFAAMTAQRIELGLAPVTALGVDATGGQGWELHHPIEHQVALYDDLMVAGQEFGIVDFGYRALDSLRLERGLPVWGKDLTTGTSPPDAGLDDCLQPDKGDFAGRQALLERQRAGVTRKLACLTVDMEGSDAWLWGGEPVSNDGRTVALLCSAGYGHVVGKSIGFAYLPSQLAVPGTALKVEITSRHWPAAVVAAPLIEPTNARAAA